MKPVCENLGRANRGWSANWVRTLWAKVASVALGKRHSSSRMEMRHSGLRSIRSTVAELSVKVMYSQLMPSSAYAACSEAKM